jgi:hypothetical protein
MERYETRLWTETSGTSIAPRSRNVHPRNKKKGNGKENEGKRRVVELKAFNHGKGVLCLRPDILDKCISALPRIAPSVFTSSDLVVSLSQSNSIWFKVVVY